MDGFPGWATRAAEFSDLPDAEDKAKRLRALFIENGSMRRTADALRSDAAAAFEHGHEQTQQSCIASAVEWETRASDGRDLIELAGGPASAMDSRKLVAEFKEMAAQCARHARIVPKNATEEDAYYAWLALLKRESQHFHKGYGMVMELVDASAAMCRSFGRGRIPVPVSQPQEDLPKVGDSSPRDSAAGPLASAVQGGEVRAVSVAVSDNYFKQAPDGLWEITYAGERRVGLKHIEGMPLIQTLLTAPGRAFPAAGFVVGPCPLEDERKIADVFHEGGLNTTSQWGGVPTLDRRAQREFQMRLKELAVEREQATARSDDEAITQIEQEYAAIEAQISADTGLGGRPRLIDSDVERTRQAASRRFHAAVKSIEKSLPKLAEHLRHCIRPGAKFVYQPDSPITWLS